MKKNIYIIIGILLVIAAGWIIFSSNHGAQQTSIVQEAGGKEVSLVIDNGGGSHITLSVGFENGMTAFDLLEKGTEKFSLALKTKKYDIGIFIEAIGNKENGQGGNYWLYYINGKFATVAADKKVIKLGDKVEFKFEKSPF